MLGFKHKALSGSNRKRLLEEYSNPLGYLTRQAKRQLLVRCVGFALLYTLSGAALLYLVVAGGDASYGISISSRQGGTILLLLGAGLLSYGLFQLGTMRRTMIARRRREIERADRKSIQKP